MSKDHLKLIIDNTESFIKPLCKHGSISIFSMSSKDKILGYRCNKCLKIFKRHEVAIIADAFGYVDYYAISD